MEGLETSFGYLSLNEGGQLTDPAYFYGSAPQIFKNFGNAPSANGAKRIPNKFIRFSGADNSLSLGTLPGLNKWSGANRFENVGLIGPPPPIPDGGLARRGSFNNTGNRAARKNHGNHTWSHSSNKNPDCDLFGGAPQGLNFHLYDSIPVRQSGPNWTPVKPIESFTDVELHQILKDNIERVQYLQPTPVQKYALPIIAAKRDLMACAQTGSGKTAAFLLPILNHILESSSENMSESTTLALDFLHSYIFLAVGRVGSTNENITQEILNVLDKDKPDMLVRFLNERGPDDRVLVFVETKRGVDLLAQYLKYLNFPVASIHGNRQQAHREQALSSFRLGRAPILIATAVAARGLDIPNVKHVINFDLPSDIEEYVHRIGRTGRMGQPGCATSFFCDRNQNVVRDLVELLRESKQTVPTWLESRLSYPADGRRTKGGGSMNKHYNNYGSLDYRQLGNRNTSYVRAPLSNNTGAANAMQNGYGLLGNCTIPPFNVDGSTRFQPQAPFNSDFFMNSQQQHAERMMYRGGPAYLGGRNAAFGPPIDHTALAPQMALLQSHSRPQHPHPATLLPPNPTAVHPLLAMAAAAAAGMHPSSVNNSINAPGCLPTSVSSCAYPTVTNPSFPAAAYHQPFHPANIFSAANAQPQSGHTRDVHPQVMFPPPPTGVFTAGTPTPSSAGSVLQHAAPMLPAAANYHHMSYYGQQQPSFMTPGSSRPHGNSPGPPATVMTALGVNPIQFNAGEVSMDNSMASCPTSTGATGTKSGFADPMYRANGVIDWWPNNEPSM